MSWRRFRADERGNMALLFAFGFTLSALVSALAVDAAALYHERRQMQAGVDLAAISAASDPSRAVEIAQSVLVEARLLAPASTEGLSVVPGHYDPEIAQVDQRFQPGMAPFNAVEVSLQRSGALYFASTFAAAPAIGVRGVAAVRPEVSFSVGSRLASLNGGLVNTILGALLGTSISLSAMDYQALAATRVDAFAFLDALAQQLGVNAGTYDDLLAMRAGSGMTAAALASLSGDASRALLTSLALGGAGNSFSIGKLLSLGALGRHSIGSGGSGGLGISLSALDILSGAAIVADGKNQISLPLSANVPGLAKLNLSLHVGEPAQGGGWFAIGPSGTVLRTAQTRLRLRAELLGGTLLAGAGVKLPLWLDLAHSEAIIVAASCPSTGAPKGEASIAMRPGLLRLAVGDMSDAVLSDFSAAPSTAPVRLIDALLLRVTAAGLVETAQTSAIRLDFSSADIAAGTVRTARTQTIATSLFGSLLGNLHLEPEILGLGLGSKSAIIQALGTLLLPLGPVLDLTVNAALAPLGLGIGEADIRVHGVRCTHPVLVG